MIIASRLANEDQYQIKVKTTLSSKYNKRVYVAQIFLNDLDSVVEVIFQIENRRRENGALLSSDGITLDSDECLQRENGH